MAPETFDLKIWRSESHSARDLTVAAGAVGRPQISDPTPELQQVAVETVDLKIWRSESHSARDLTVAARVVGRPRTASP